MTFIKAKVYVCTIRILTNENFSFFPNKNCHVSWHWNVLFFNIINNLFYKANGTKFKSSLVWPAQQWTGLADRKQKPNLQLHWWQSTYSIFFWLFDLNYENKFIDRIFLKLIISAGDSDSYQKMNLPRFRLSEKYPVVKWTLLILPLLLLLPLVVADIQVNHLFTFLNIHKYE